MPQSLKNGLTFPKVEIDAAGRKMLSRQIYLSRVAKEGTAMRLAHSSLVERCLVSAYADGFRLRLTIYLNVSGTLDSIKIAPIVLNIMKTESAEMRRRLAAR